MPEVTYTYIVKHGTALTSTDFIEGMIVCFEDVDDDPNLLGILENTVSANGKANTWKSVINGVRYTITDEGKAINGDNPTQWPQIYEAVYINDNGITLDKTSATTRAGGQGESNKVSVKNLLAKDHFAIAALEILMSRIPSPLSMNDGTIAAICSKAYKIAQGMMLAAYNARQNDEASEASGEPTVPLDSSDLTSNSEKLLYNINANLVNLKNALNTLNTDGLSVKNVEDDKLKVETSEEQAQA